MRKLVISEITIAICLIVIGSMVITGGLVAFAQDAPQNAPKSAATPAKIETGKDKPIIVTKAQIIQSDNLAKDLKIAQLEAEAAIPPQLKARITAAQQAIDEYYIKEIGVARDKLSEYEISNGVDGALILRKKVVAAVPDKK